MAELSTGLRFLDHYKDIYDAPKRKSSNSYVEESSPTKKQKRESNEGDRARPADKERRKEKKSKRSKDHDRSSKKQLKQSLKQEVVPETFYEEIGKWSVLQLESEKGRVLKP